MGGGWPLIGDKHMPHTVMIGGLRTGDCHTEMEVDSRDEAIAYLHALSRKTKPEHAIADIGDFRTWIGNDWPEVLELTLLPQRDKIVQLIALLDADDVAAELRENTFLPDIRIEPIAEGRATVASTAMRYEAPCKWGKVAQVVSELIAEYQDLIAAGEITPPLLMRKSARRKGRREACLRP